MGKLILVTGGARSGKSSFAEDKVKGFGENILYIATSVPFDEEMKLRIKKHREQRPPYWETLEAYKDMDIQLEGSLNGRDAILLDCITIMVTNIMFESSMDWESLQSEDMAKMEEDVKKQIQKLLTVLKASLVPCVLVTNEIGMGIVPDSAISRLFRDIAGRTNQMLAREADEVYLCVSGIPVKIKG